MTWQHSQMLFSLISFAIFNIPRFPPMATILSSKHHNLKLLQVPSQFITFNVASFTDDPSFDLKQPLSVHPPNGRSGSYGWYPCPSRNMFHNFTYHQ